MGLGQPWRCIVIGHRILVATCLFGAVLATVLLGAGRATGYTASSRIEATTATLGSDTEADSVLNRVKGIATSTAVVARALRASAITTRNAVTVAGNEIAVSRLGSSPVMDITISDADPRIAERLASQLADQVVEFLDGSDGTANDPLAQQLQRQQHNLLSKRQALIAQLGSAPAGEAAGLSARLSTVEQELSDVASTLRQLEVGVQAAGTAAVVSHADTATAATSHRVIDLVLGAIVGLIAGLLAATTIEAVRPRIAGGRAVAAELDAPYLGDVEPGRRRNAPTPETSPAEPELVLSLRGAVARAQACEVVMTGELRSDRSIANLRLALAGLEQPSPNGHSSRKPATFAQPGAQSSKRQRGGSGRSGSSATATRAEPDRPTMSERAVTGVRLTTADQVETFQASTSRALLVLTGDYMSIKQLHRIRDLARSTGWPVVGVVHVRPQPSGKDNDS